MFRQQVESNFKPIQGPRIRTFVWMPSQRSNLPSALLAASASGSSAHTRHAQAHRIWKIWGSGESVIFSSLLSNRIGLPRLSRFNSLRPSSFPDWGDQFILKSSSAELACPGPVIWFSPPTASHYRQPRHVPPKSHVRCCRERIPVLGNMQNLT